MASRPETARDSAGAAELELTEEELTMLEAAVRRGRAARSAG
ncbi:hypothetical protein [Streptomyces sp. CAI-85]|nr:hypothetical protein [Streptomyces sp. CAI-85]